jgi:hypothetical protein
MIVSIFLILMSINFNVASANPHGVLSSALSNNKSAIICMWAAIIYAVLSTVYGLLKV